MSTPSPLRVRVMTMNVQGVEGPPERQRLLNDLVRRADPDLLALQEVHDVDHLRALLDGTGLHGTHQSDVMSYRPPFVDRYGGTAVATRWPHRIREVLDQRMLDAPDVPWCTLAAAVDLPSIGEVLFVSTTFSWRLDAEAARERQALAVADLDARHRTAVPTLVAGDLNAEPDAASVRFLTGRAALQGRSVHFHDAWAVAGEGPGHTWTADNPRAAHEIDTIIRQPGHRRRLDYVLVGSWHAHPTARAEIHSATLIGHRPTEDLWASDHFGVLCELAISADPAQ